MDTVSHLIRLARLQGRVDVRCLLAGRPTLDNPARRSGEVPFHLLLEGRCTVEAGARTIDLRAGDVIVLPRGTAHRVRAGGEGPTTAMVEEPGGAFPTLRSTGADSEIDLFCGHYTYGPGAGDLLFGTLPDPLHVSFGAESSEPVRMLSALMRSEAQSDRPGTAAIVSSLCDALLAMVLRSTPEQRLAGDVLWTAVDDERLRAVIDTALRDPGHDWTIAELAGTAAMSRATFVRHFTHATGTTVGDFLTRIRMMTAAELLTSTDRPVSAIAATVGYRSESAFGRAFRLATATTPARFRRHTAPARLGRDTNLSGQNG